MSTERIQNIDHHKEIEYNGKKFRSNFEVETAKTLDALGMSYRYEERKIILQDGFRSPFQKDKVRSVTYTPDFEIGSLMIECKGFETPEWKIKKKLLFKWLMENEPETIFYMVKNTKQLLQALDPHWSYLGYCIKVTPKPKGKKATMLKGFPLGYKLYDSLNQAFDDLNLTNKSITPILRSFTGQREYVYNYKWQLVKVNL